jgi:hypothetical protein
VKFFKKTDKIVLKLLSFFFKNGKLKKQLNGFLKVFSNFFLFFDKTIPLKSYINMEEFNFILKNNKHYKNISNLLN